MEIYFNNLAVPRVVGFSADRATRNSKVEYNANGDMLIDMVVRKYKLTIYLGELNASEMAAVMNETESVFFNVSFYAPQYGEIQRSFHLSEQPCEVEYAAENNIVYKATKLVLEEK